MKTSKRFDSIVLMACVSASILCAACSRERDTTGASSEPTAAQTPPTVPAPAVTQASWAPDALEELLAPIALYPDQLLGQILAASVNSQEVLDAGNWLLENQNLSGKALDDAAQKLGFGAAMRALLQFPTVVDMLCQEIDWTRQVGSAFSSDQKSVLDAVQRLRLQAAEVGNLKSTPEQTVETKTENNQTIVEVKPADPQVVYVPQYNPQVVYTTPPLAPAAAPATTTTVDDPNTVSTGTAIAGGLLAFGAGMLIGNAMDDDDDDYCCYPNWGHSTVIVGSRPFYPPAYAYRPAYGSGMRPAYRYNSPAGYRNRYNSGNVTINNNDYYNRFSNNQNLRNNSVRSPIRNTDNTLAQTRGNRAESWKGQSTYQGARNDAVAGKLDRAAGNARDRAAGGARSTAYKGARPESTRLADASSGSDASAFTRTREQRASQTSQRSSIDRGYGDASRPERNADIQRDVARPAQTEVQRPAQSLQTAPERSRDSALAGASARESGSFERAASARGRASSGGRAEGRAGGRGGRR